MAQRVVKFEPLDTPTSLELTGVRIIYEPSVFGGTGDEVRKNIVFEIPPDVITAVQQHEASIASSCTDAPLCSCLKGDALKCKISMDSVQIFDSTCTPTQPPGVWRDLPVNAIVDVKGKWSTRTQTGLSVVVRAIQLLDSRPRECPFPVIRLPEVTCMA